MRTGIVQLDADHPGFHDVGYRRRRDEIARLALDHRPGDAPPRVDYTADETATWATVLRGLVELHPTHACRSYRDTFAELGCTARAIPQLAEVDRFLQARTGFRIQPVAGLVGARDFLATLGRRVFPATQYLRHASVPHYTPEPDVVHEILGHVPMLADPALADLTQLLGQGTETADDAEIEARIRLYWYTVEFGLVREEGQLRAWGAGLLSSYGELARALSGAVEVRPLDVAAARARPYPITTYQPLLFEVPSVRGALEMLARGPSPGPSPPAPGQG